MSKYDLNDPTDVDIMKAQFDMYTAEEWEEFIELAEEDKMGYKNINILKTAMKTTNMKTMRSRDNFNWLQIMTSLSK